MTWVEKTTMLYEASKDDETENREDVLEMSENLKEHVEETLKMKEAFEDDIEEERGICDDAEVISEPKRTPGETLKNTCLTRRNDFERKKEKQENT